MISFLSLTTNYYLCNMTYTCHFNFFIKMVSIVNFPLQHSICYKKSKDLINKFFLVRLGENAPSGYHVIYHQVWVEKCSTIIRWFFHIYIWGWLEIPSQLLSDFPPSSSGQMFKNYYLCFLFLNGLKIT
jgi:hypothetical protein